MLFETDQLVLYSAKYIDTEIRCIFGNRWLEAAAKSKISVIKLLLPPKNWVQLYIFRLS